MDAVEEEERQQKKKIMKTEFEDCTVCSMCGDVGIPHFLCLCIKCCQRYQHMYCSRSYPSNSMASNQSMICNWCLHEQDLLTMPEHDSNLLITPNVINDTISGLNGGVNCPQSSINQDLGKIHNISPQSSTNCPKLNIVYPQASKNLDTCPDRGIACTQSSTNHPRLSRSNREPGPDEEDTRTLLSGNRVRGKLNHLSLATNHPHLTANHQQLKIKPTEAITKRSNHSKAFDYLLMVTAESTPEEKSENKNHHKVDQIENQKISNRQDGSTRSSEASKTITTLKKKYNIRSSMSELNMSDLKYRKKGVQLNSPIRSNYRRYKLLADVLC